MLPILYYYLLHFYIYQQNVNAKFSLFLLYSYMQYLCLQLVSILTIFLFLIYKLQHYDMVKFYFHCFCLRQFTHCFSQLILISMARLPSLRPCHFLLVLTLYQHDKFSFFSKFQAFWPIYPIQSQRSYLLCNRHAFNSSFGHSIYIHFFHQLRLSLATCLFSLKRTHHQL